MLLRCIRLRLHITEIKLLYVKHFGLKVRMLRFEIGMTQEELEEKAELHPTYVGSVERGKRNIALENIIALSKALSCSPKDFMPE